MATRFLIGLGIAIAVALGAAPETAPDRPVGLPLWCAAMREDLTLMAHELTARVTAWPVPDRTCDVDAFGAVNDGRTLSTVAVQRAIDACAAAGGGVVLFSRGDYVIGTIDLKSNVMLEVAAGAQILASTDLADYPDRVAARRTVMDTNMGMKQSLIFAEGVERVGIRGKGRINFRGSHENFPGKQTVGSTPGRPFGIRVLDSRNVVLQDITLVDSASWMQNYLNCENLLIERITVDNHANWNNDGLDIDGCRDVIVRDSYINSEDDALCFKGASLMPTQNVLVERCKIFSTCNAVKFGTDTQGDFRNVLIRDVEVGGPRPDDRAIRRRPASSGFSFMSVDGGTVENVLVQNARIDRAHSPLFLRIGARGRVMPGMPKPDPGHVRKIVFEGITGAANGGRGSFFSGIAEREIEDIVLRRVRLEVAGGIGEVRDPADIPEARGGYPDAQGFGKFMPAYGLWLRHTDRVTFDDVAFTPVKPDRRPAVVAGPSARGPTVVRPATTQPTGSR